MVQAQASGGQSSESVPVTEGFESGPDTLIGWSFNAAANLSTHCE